MKSTAAAMEPVRERLSTIRAELTAKKTERAKVYGAPIPKAEALAVMVKTLDAQAEAFRSDGMNIAAIAKRTNDPADFRLFRSYGLGEDLSDRIGSGLLWLVCGPAIRKTMEAELDRWYADHPHPPMTDKDRCKALTRLDSEISDLAEAERELMEAAAAVANA